MTTLKTTLFGLFLLVGMTGCKNNTNSENADVETVKDTDRTGTIIEGVPGNSSFKNVPNDSLATDPLVDFSNLGFKPLALNETQHYEWLGDGVTEEKKPKKDEFNDGVFIINPKNLVAGEVIRLGVRINSRYGTKPGNFPKGSSATLGVWIDWNYSLTYEDQKIEKVYADKVDIPVVIKGKTFSRYWLIFKVRVPKGFKADKVLGEENKLIGIRYPPIRARLSWYSKPPIKAPKVGGRESFGEVEDLVAPINDMFVFNDKLKRSSIGNPLAVMIMDEELQVTDTFAADSITLEDLDLIFTGQEENALEELLDVTFPITDDILLDENE